jgi:hypothetical protein
LSGLPRERFQIVDGEMLSWHGSRTPAGIDYAEQVIAGRHAERVVIPSGGRQAEVEESRS